MFFKQKQTTTLGIDIGASGVKAVELMRQAGRVTLSTYGHADVAMSGDTGDIRDNPSSTGAMVRALVKETGAKAHRASVSLPTFSVFSSIIHFPRIPKKEIPDAVRRETAKLMTTPVDDMLLNWEELSVLPTGLRRAERAAKQAGDLTRVPASPDEDKKTMHLLVTAVARTLVAKYVEIFKVAGIELASLETEAFALVRSLVGNDRSLVLVMDIGGKNTDFSIIDGGVPILNRSLDVGGAQITKTLATLFGLPPATAEQVKCDLAYRTLRNSGAAPATIPPALERVLAPLVNEITYIRGLYAAGDKAGIEKIILTGGSAWLLGFDQYLSKRFNMTVILGDPWARVAVPNALRPVLDRIGPRMNVAVGLAMRDV